MDPVTLQAHGKHAQAVTFTKSGRLLLSAGQDAHIRIWSVPGFKPVGAIVGHRNSVNSLAFSPDESMLATSSSDGTVRIWSFPEGRCDRILQRQNSPRFSPSGRWLATVSTKAQVTLWDVESGESVFRADGLDKRLFGLEFSPDERTLFVAGTGRIHRLSLPAGSNEGSFEAHQQAVASLRISPDGRWLVSTGAPGTLRIWSVPDQAPVATVQLEAAGMMSTAISPDSAEASTGVDFYIVTVSLRDRVVSNRLRVGVKGVYGLAYSSDGKYLANAAADGKVRVWQR